jgi:ornithine cyclodeaminase
MGALAAKYLANESVEQAAVIGSGPQAYIQLKSLMAVRNIKSVLIWDYLPYHADDYLHRLSEDHDLYLEIAPSVEVAIQQADIVITTTASQTPLIQAEWLKTGVHITTVGSHPAPKRELYPEVLQRADIIIVDSLEQSTAQGEIHEALKRNLIGRENIRGELGSLVAGKIAGRTHPDQITVADLVGLDSQDTALATLAMDKALFLGLGQRIEIGLGQKGLNSEVESLSS